MAFKLDKPPYSSNSTPIYRVGMEDGVLGKANNNGTIILRQGMTLEQEDEVIDHEMVHIDQMLRGDLDYDEKYVYWKGKKIPRSSMKEGAKNLPWEKEAYDKA
tara:strand:- start:1616 stop:1924 length:309 start_codon:yes stop_codon:yes gene_type:complete